MRDSNFFMTLLAPPVIAQRRSTKIVQTRQILVWQPLNGFTFSISPKSRLSPSVYLHLTACLAACQSRSLFLYFTNCSFFFFAELTTPPPKTAIKFPVTAVSSSNTLHKHARLAICRPKIRKTRRRRYRGSSGRHVCIITAQTAAGVSLLQTQSN